MDNDIFIPYKFRASQIVGLAKVAVKAIETEGMKLREGNTSSGIVNKIGWYNEAAAIYKEFITGVSVIKRHLLLLQAGNGPAKAEGELWSTVLELVGSDIEPAANSVGAFLKVAFKTTKAYIGTTIIDESLQSSFLQLCRGRFGFGAYKEIDFGESELVWPAASNLSSITVVPHQLNKVPQLVLATPHESGTGATIAILNPFGYTAANFGINGWWPSAAGPGSMKFKWIAIG